jgi:hypothetical protein
MLGDVPEVNYYKLFMIYMILEKLAKKSENIKQRVHQFIGSIVNAIVGGFINDMNNTINYADFTNHLINLSTLSEFFTLPDFMNDLDELNRFQNTLVNDLTANRLIEPIEKACMISLSSRLMSYKYEKTLEKTLKKPNWDRRPVIGSVKGFITIAKWFETQFFHLEECDAFLAMQVSKEIVVHIYFILETTRIFPK